MEVLQSRWSPLGSFWSGLLLSSLLATPSLTEAAPRSACQSCPSYAPCRPSTGSFPGNTLDAVPGEQPLAPAPDLADAAANEPELPLEQFAATGGDMLALADNFAAYIDNARPMTMFRLRFDASYDNTAPNRAEYIYARGAPLGPGVPLIETKADYQEFMGYLELAPTECFSVFAEFGMHLINPVVNNNSGGIADSNAGFKQVLLQREEQTLTAQLKCYFPSGDADRGLGNNHFSLEPALLYFGRFSQRVNLSGELRYWVPINGTEGFAGDIIRYGVGANYLLWQDCERYISPTLEVVGWTVLNGGVTQVTSPTTAIVLDATGDTIVNVKPGVRFGLSKQSDFYVGYGRCISGDAWYRDVLRVEYRRSF